jgi:hypothetical protein
MLRQNVRTSAMVRRLVRCLVGSHPSSPWIFCSIRSRSSATPIIWRQGQSLLKRVPAGLAVPVGRQRRQGPPLLRLYDWAFIGLDDDQAAAGGQRQRWLLVRRNRTTRKLAFYRCWMPRLVPLAILVLVAVAGRRWTIEERFQTSKGLIGLDAHQVVRRRGLLVSLDHSGHGCPRLPRGGRCRPTRPRPCPIRVYRVDLQRGPPAVRRPARHAHR